MPPEVMLEKLAPMTSHWRMGKREGRRGKVTRIQDSWYKPFLD
jgi:hypothetical protein